MTDKQTAEAVLRGTQRPREKQPLGSPRGREAARIRIQALCDVLPPDAELESARTALHEALASRSDNEIGILTTYAPAPQALLRARGSRARAGSP